MTYEGEDSRNEVNTVLNTWKKGQNKAKVKSNTIGYEKSDEPHVRGKSFNSQVFGVANMIT